MVSNTGSSKDGSKNIHGSSMGVGKSRVASKGAKSKAYQSNFANSIVGSKFSSSSKAGGNTRSSAPGSKALRVMVDGNDLTPLSLLDESSSLAIPNGGNQQKGNSNLSIFSSSTNGMENQTQKFNLSTIETREESKSYGGNDVPKLPTSPTAANIGFLEKSNARSVLPSADELAKNVTIILSETPTETLFSMKSLCVGAESLEHPIVTELNAAYLNLCNSKDGSDLYICRRAQTYNESLKNSEVSTAAMPVEDSACQVTSWDIFDNMSETSKVARKPRDSRSPSVDYVDSGTGMQSPREQDKNSGIGMSSTTASNSFAVWKRNQVESIVKKNLAENGCLLPLDLNNEGQELSTEYNPDHELNESLLILERGIQQNVYHKKHLLYRAIPNADKSFDGDMIAEDIPVVYSEEKVEKSNDEIAPNEISDTTETNDESKGDTDQQATMSNTNENETQSYHREKPSLQLLFTFHCDEVKNRNISGMAWNHVNQDLLAVSYCQFDFASQMDGLILFWTLKNPEYPERIIRCPSGVCSIDFSHNRPSLLAAGMYDGTIAIYDLHREGPQALQPILQSNKVSNQHKDAVWQVKWVNKQERGEVLVSLSTDGRVTEWSLKKGLTSTDLMVLKRVNVPASLGGLGEGIISRTAAGLALDFPIHDSSIYFTGTEDGTIHKCSCSYNEQYLGTYFGHAGPIYKLKCSPYWHDSFITCSADWSVRFWDSNEDQPLLHFQSVDLADEVYDVEWSHSHSTIFGLVAADGRLEIWDLRQNVLDPVITQFISEDAEMRARIRATANGVAPPAPPNEQSEASHHEKAYFSSLAFAYNASVVTAGTTTGEVHVYRLRGIAEENSSFEESVSVLKSIVEQNKKQ